MKKIILVLFMASIYFCSAQIDTIPKPEIGLLFSYDTENESGFGFSGRYLNYGLTMAFNNFDEFGNPSNYIDTEIPHSSYKTREYKTATYYILFDGYLYAYKWLAFYGSIGVQEQTTSKYPISEATGWAYKAVGKTTATEFVYGGGINFYPAGRVGVRIGYTRSIGIILGISATFI